MQRQREGIEIAKSQGKYLGRKPIEHPEFQAVVKKWKKEEITGVEAMRQLDMAPSTFYRKVKNLS